MSRAWCVLVVALFFRVVHSWDLAVTAGDQIAFYSHDGNLLDTVHINSQNLSALVYDEVHNLLLYIEKKTDNDTICGFSMTSKKYKCYIERNGRNIQGLAFDPVTESLFFTDTVKRSINSFSFKPRSINNVYGNLVIKNDYGIPTDIIVDSCRGYIYWINTNLTKSSIERARFNGSDRQVVITATNKFDLHSLAIDQRTQKIFWIEPETNVRTKIYKSDLNGKSWELLETFYYKSKLMFTHPNTLAVFKDKLFSMVDWTSTPKNKYIWEIKLKPTKTKKLLMMTGNVVGIATNYKMKDQFEGISDCSHIPNNYEDNKIAKEYEGPFCVSGRDNGQPLCVRCEESVCKNYCIQGSCSITEEGLPKCRCNAGYSGERCEVNVCKRYCLNLGTCSFNGNSEPVCQCKQNYSGNRCEISVCEKYCMQGNCSLTEKGLPKCRCNAGYSGERCEVNVCNGYCLNNGTCSLNEEDDPVCECVGTFEGRRCDVAFCQNNIDMPQKELVKPDCQCVGTLGSSNGIHDKNKIIATTSTNLPTEGHLNVTVVVEIKSNN